MLFKKKKFIFIFWEEGRSRSSLWGPDILLDILTLKIPFVYNNQTIYHRDKNTSVWTQVYPNTETWHRNTSQSQSIFLSPSSISCWKMTTRTVFALWVSKATQITADVQELFQNTVLETVLKTMVRVMKLRGNRGDVLQKQWTEIRNMDTIK